MEKHRKTQATYIGAWKQNNEQKNIENNKKQHHSASIIKRLLK